MAHSPQTRDAACTMYQQGATIAEVARFYSLPPACVSEWLRKQGIPRRCPGRRRRHTIPDDMQAVFTLVDAGVARDQACEMVGVSKQTALVYWATFRPMSRLKPGRPRKNHHHHHPANQHQHRTCHRPWPAPVIQRTRTDQPAALPRCLSQNHRSDDAPQSINHQPRTSTQHHR